ncbi:MAG TPA: ABC transporter permease [Vicinamibacteria bacterium]|nr:ABC transporter permease [Vicinamibacteria bacterium]
MGARLARFLYRRPALGLALLLLLPLLWMGLLYVGSLFALVIQSFFRLDDFTGLVVRRFTLDTWRSLLLPAHVDIAQRTVTMAALVTLADAVLAFPLAYYMARYASGRVKALLAVGVLLPLWSSYLVRVYAWKLILAKEGMLTWLLGRLGLSGVLDGILQLPGIGGPSLSVSPLGTFVAFVYVWLPYMVLPIQAALERVPRSLLEASADLGAHPLRTFASVTLPLALPGVVAGSIFTFSLTLGDFIVPGTLGNSSPFIGQAVLAHQGTAGNVPLAAAFTAIPMAIMAVYLMLAKRLGAFDAL